MKKDRCFFGNLQTPTTVVTVVTRLEFQEKQVVTPSISYPSRLPPKKLINQGGYHRYHLFACFGEASRPQQQEKCLSPRTLVSDDPKIGSESW
jgi:hypothetical protein